MMRMNRKGQNVELLVGIVVSTIIYLIILVVLFAFHIPQQTLNLCAGVVSSDAALSCEVSLNNLMRSTADGKITYADLLVNSHTNNNFDTFSSNVESLYNKVLSQGKWDMTVHLPDSTPILKLGQVSETVDTFGCNYTIPFQAAAVQKFCSVTAERKLDTTSIRTFTVELPDGTIVCRVIDGAQFGLEQSDTCPLNLAPETIFDDPAPSTTDDTTDEDIIIVPIQLNDVNYDAVVQEDSPGQGFGPVTVTIVRSTVLDECGLTVQLRSANVSAIGTCNNFL